MRRPLTTPASCATPTPPIGTSFKSARGGETATRRRAQAVLRAEPFSPEALLGVAAQAKEERKRFEQTVDRHVAAAVAAMSPEGRRRLADFFD